MDFKDWPSPLIGLANGWEAWRALTEGQNGFFVPRSPFETLAPGSPGAASFYDTKPLKATPEQFAKTVGKLGKIVLTAANSNVKDASARKRSADAKVAAASPTTRFFTASRPAG